MEINHIQSSLIYCLDAFILIFIICYNMPERDARFLLENFKEN